MKIKPILIVVFLLAALSVKAGAPEQPLVHVVLLWLKEPGNLEQRQRFINACRHFVAIPGVIDLRIGQPAMSDRKIVDDSFDVGLYVIVENKQALENYLTHPLHTEAVNIAKPIAKRFLAYDFFDQIGSDCKQCRTPFSSFRKP